MKSQLAQFLVAGTIMIAVAEFMTRRGTATLRWCILASVWLVLCFLLFWVVGLE